MRTKTTDAVMSQLKTATRQRIAQAFMVLVLSCLCCASYAAISVGPGGSGVISFDAIPSPTEFATGRLPGAGTDYLNTTNVDAAVATVDASQIVQSLPISSTVPPSTSTAGFVYNRVWQLIQSRPAGVAAVILKATLRNDTGGPVTSLQVRYDFEKQSTNVQGELPGHYVYYSLTGATGSWAKVEQLYGVDLAGRRTANIALPTWAPGAELFILWVDDNTASTTDPSYTLNHFSFLPSVSATNVSGGISMGEGGTEMFRFETMPSPLEWSTLSIAGLPTDIETAESLDAQVQLLDATNVDQALRVSTAYPPSGNNVAKWSSLGQYLVTRPMGNAYQVLMATIKNHTGRTLEAVQLSYALNVIVAEGTTIAEEVAGHRVFFSQSGAPNSWKIIPELSGDRSGPLTAIVPLDAWPDGASLFVLWADDNAEANDDRIGLEEAAYTIDDFVVAPLLRLKLVRTFGTQGYVVWPQSAFQYRLQERSNLGDAWQPTTGADQVIGSFHMVQVNFTSPSQFFRLVQP